MLNALARYQKTIAWFFAGIFYLELITVPVMTRAAVSRSVVHSRFIPLNADRDLTGKKESTRPFTDDKDASPLPFPGVITAGKEKGPGITKKKFTTGPTQPEMQSFQSVNANNMVDLFTGDFSYNIPLLDVGGYPVNLGYSSGITMDQEASWVGLGWNINPGTITRNMRGLPDDFKGQLDAVTKTISMKPNKTVGVTIGGNIELFGRTQFTEVKGKNGAIDSIKGRSGTVGLSLGVFHNTYKGWGTEVGLNANINSGTGAKGPLTGGLSITNNSQNGLDISPSLGFHIGKNDAKTRGDITVGTNFNSRTGIQNLQISGEVKQHLMSYRSQNYSISATLPSYISFSKPSYTPTISVPFTSGQASFTVKLGSEHWALHPSFYVRGYGSTQRIEAKDTSLTLPAYGYLYYDKANNNQDVLLDFNREKDVSYNNKSPHIAVPIYTYDTYSITGEGTGGMFRPYRGDIGYVFDHTMATKSNSDRLSVDIGLGSVVHGGIDYNTVYSSTRNSPWMKENAIKDVIGFRKQDTTFENVYFKNPGEKTAVNRQLLDAIGDDNLVRVDLSPRGDNISSVFATRNLSLFQNAREIGKRTITANTLRRERDKRTQVISYLPAMEAAAAGLDRVIKSYDVNSFPATTCNTNYRTIKRVDRVGTGVRQAHHLSEITVLNADGRRYVYGIPVYNISQTEVTMSTAKGDNITGLVDYIGGTDNTTNNRQGKEGYFNKEELPGYAHSFLLTGILSDNYVDVTGDGITEDDNGEAVKFNYSRVYGNNAANAYKWRAPFQQNKAAYNEGLKTDSRDERGSYTYGEREVWYMNSIESKTMIATFVLETDVVRKDGFGTIGEDGGINTDQKLYRLKEINLYTKADFLKNGQAQAKPVKTVHFEYSYELCKKNPGSQSDSGKLTLKKVWFTYNKNNKGQLNPYVFTYHAKNPDYSSKSTDRWGNYKDAARNPGTGQVLTNADYPYTLQDNATWNKDSADANAAPWALYEIKMPSGGKIKVTYESDDYAFVQNKRAMQFFTLAGFDSIATGAVHNNLYLHRPKNASKDYFYVFVNVTEPVADKAAIQRKYLDGVSQLFFKLAVNMPPDRWGKGYESIPCYADIEDYGVKTGGNNKTIWIKVKPLDGARSPFVTVALQFLRLNLPSKAYPYSEPGDNFNLKTVLGTLASAADNIKSSVNGFNDHGRNNNWCNSLILDKSFVRLDNPIYKKYGGGLRVKRIEVKDNWYNMTAQQQQEAVYGQDYDYTTTLNVNGVDTVISSGVATYEPAVGNDENPFRVPHKVYTEKVGALAPVDYLYTEEPFAETFFPAPMVGYSKVRVQTIHKTKKSANGFSETEFYTTRDFPVLVEYTPIDNESKKTYDPPLANILRFDAKHYVTLSQGFKVELNDMNGKLKSQAAYAQTDLKTPVSYTQNYYRLENDNTLRQKLSNKAAVIDSSNGRINYDGEIGKEVEIMIDVRQQVSTTISASIEANVDFAHPFPPIILPSAIPLPSKETNQYRSIAVTKVVNRYGILDSVIHIQKGSKVTTRNLIYDAETGEVLVTQTNNEFDDPVYNFNYPAHWAYSGMGPAYKNTGAVFSGLLARQGKVFYSNGVDTFPMHRFFESGDELLLYTNSIRMPLSSDTCSGNFYQYFKIPLYGKVWVIDASRGSEHHRGMYLIDAGGRPYSGEILTAKVLRSGRRNMASTPVGTITSLKSPVKMVNSIPRLVFDSTTGVIASQAARFKDFWRVDSTLFRKDTTMIMMVRSELDSIELAPTASYTIHTRNGERAFVGVNNPMFFEAFSYDLGRRRDDGHTKSWLRYDFSELPAGVIVQSASLSLHGMYARTQINERNSNMAYIQRTKGRWVADAVNAANWTNKTATLAQYFRETGPGAVETSTRVTVPATPRNVESYRSDVLTVTSMVQNMIYDYWGSNRNYVPAIMIKLTDPFGAIGADTIWSRMAYYAGFIDQQRNCAGKPFFCKWPAMKIRYYKPCASGSSPVYAASPVPGYYCLQAKDTFVCRPNIDSIFNPYVWGVWGNWRVDRAYTYYDRRVESDVAVATNIRTGGEIKSFKPFWAFTNQYLTAGVDTNRWVWNGEATLVNSKGYELENHDPLDRYNAGQYGYNRTLPVAVIQNSKNRNAAFDGFEDYNYRTDTCTKCPPPRFIDLSNGGNRVDTVSHTGKYSIRIAGNQTGSSQIPVVAYAKDTVTPKISLRIDSTPIVKTIVNSKGNGLRMEYMKTSIVGCPSIQPNQWYYMFFTNNIADNRGGGSAPGVCPSNMFKLRWTGTIQPKYSETYRFYAKCDDYMRITVNGRRISNGRPMEKLHNGNTYYPTDTITLQAGSLYNIVVEYTELYGNAYYYLDWESASQAREIVPRNVLYAPGADTTDSFKSDTTWCVKPRAPRPTRVTLDNFSPLQGTKLVVSAWVKEDAPCITGMYLNNSLELQFNNGSPSNFILKPKGPVIEGWQRIEDTLTIPPTATNVTVKLRSLSSTAVFFDDIRIHPFNANMKSFVYNPVNIRLMAELDENNYATFYEYDDDGTLIRVKKETERGIKTLKETRSALLKD
jgi:hypothetical protein